MYYGEWAHDKGEPNMSKSCWFDDSTDTSPDSILVRVIALVIWRLGGAFGFVIPNWVFDELWFLAC